MSYGSFVYVEGKNLSGTWKQLPIGETAGRDEAWLRDTLHRHPALLPVADIDPSYGPLVPICTELPTPSGRIDNVFADSRGRLTLVECKLWRNIESRRKLVAQLLDYAAAISRWSYSDLQARVNARLGKSGNQLFDLVRAQYPHLIEQQFVDVAGASLRQGKFLLLLAGDGIKDEVQRIGELLNRNAGAAYSFGMFEVGMYEGPGGEILAQPRVIVRTQAIERVVVVLRNGEVEPFPGDQEAEETSQSDSPTSSTAAAAIHQAARDWWEPLLGGLQDPNQPEFRYFWPHNIRGPLPWPGTWITAYRKSGSQSGVGVFVGGREEPLRHLLAALVPICEELASDLPEETVLNPQEVAVFRPMSSFKDDEQAKAWLGEAINRFVTALRPRIYELVGH